MIGLKLKERFRTIQVHAFSPSETSTGKNPAAATRGKLINHKIKPFSKSKPANSVAVAEALLPYGLPKTDLLEPSIDPHLKPIDLPETLADLYGRLETASQSKKSLLFMEQYSVLRCLGDPKLLRRCLCAARQNAEDVHSKVVLSAWLRFVRREDELVGVSAMDCGGHILECPKAALVSGYCLNSVHEHCEYLKDHSEVFNQPILKGNECLNSDGDSDVSFCIGNEEIKCVRYRIAALSRAFKVMLFGRFLESKLDKIDFSRDGISVKGMRAVEVYSRTRRLDLFSPEVVLELLSFANRFCCEEMKSACDAYLASLVHNIEEALVLIEYGLEETANLLVATCLQLLLRELPKSLYNWKVMRLFCSSEAMERLARVGHASFLLYYFLSQVAMDESMVSNMTVMLLERLEECATESWQKALALHQLGVVFLERKQYKDAQGCFAAAAVAGHVYSMAGVARAKYNQGQQYTAYKLMSSLISEYKPVGWMYQDRSLYNIGKEKTLDLEFATKLDPTLSFPYKYRAVAMVEEKQISAAILEMDKIIGFKLSPDCLELRAWFFIALEDYESALRDVRVVLTLEPNYMMFHGKVAGDYLIELLSQCTQQWNLADCWMQLYQRWSCIDDVGSLAVIHQMLVTDPRKSLLQFRQSLLLLRLNCQKAAMRSLRLARNHASSEHERLVYEGWILYDTGHREEALSRADKSISIQRSFEALFLKAYTMADTSLDAESSSYVVKIMEEALKCPSDGLRKGQALNNLGSIYVDSGKLDLAADCYTNALEIKHTRAHQGLARVYHQRNQRQAAYDEMTKLIEMAQNNASAYEKRSEYCCREMAKNDLDMATQLDPLRTYPYRYRAAVLMDDQKETEAIEELTKAIVFKPDLQMLHLRAAFHESMGNLTSALQDCQAALCFDPDHKETLDLYNQVRKLAVNQQLK